MAVAVVGFNASNVYIYGIDGAELKNIVLASPLAISVNAYTNPQIASNEDCSIIVIAVGLEIRTITATNEYSYNVGTNPDDDIDVYGVLYLAYSDGKFRAFFRTVDDISGNYSAQQDKKYFESSDGITWTLVYHGETDTINGSYREVNEIKYDPVLGKSIVAESYDYAVWYTEVFSTYLLCYAYSGYYRRFFPADNAVWACKYVTGTYSHTNVTDTISKFVSGSKTDYVYTNVPANVSAKDAPYGVLRYGDNTLYVIVQETYIDSSVVIAPYFFNGTSFAREDSLAYSVSTWAQYPFLFYDNSVQQTYKLTAIGTNIDESLPISISIVDGSNNLNTFVLPVAITNLTIVENYALTDEFWTEEIKAIESTYTYGT